MAYIKRIFPSILSSFRLLAALAFPFCPSNLWAWLIIGAGLSDIFDGWLARKWHVESWQGGLIDAIADKFFVLTVLIVFVTDGKFSPFWIPVVISRDILVLCTATYIAALRVWGSFTKMSARISGKLTTGGQFILFLTVIFAPDKTSAALFFASFCSLLAAYDYGRLFIQALTEHSLKNRQ
jgi:phosphatidylglycerophosphate synthase